MNKMFKGKKVLLWDIERFPGVYYGWSRFDPPFNQKEVSTLSLVCYKWLGEKKVHTIQLTKAEHKENPRNEKVLHEKMLKVMNEADVLVGYNGDKFDWKKFNAGVIKYGLAPAKKPKLIDPLKMIKRESSFDSHKLEDMCRELGVHLKMSTEKGLFINSMKQWRSYEELAEYCRHDVLALESLFKRIMPYCVPIINQAGMNNLLKACATCGSEDIIKFGTYILNNGSETQRYRCKKCGSTKTRDSANGKKTLTAI